VENGLVFGGITLTVSSSLDLIESGAIMLPELQRPFVWKDKQVIDLLDSMYKGFPIGTFLFWRNPFAVNSGNTPLGHTGNTTGKQPNPDYLVIDGQQRLTSLYAIFRDKVVIDKEYHERDIRVSFCPTTGEFKVRDAATANSLEWIADLGKALAGGKGAYQVAKEHLVKLEAKREVLEAEEETIHDSIQRLFNILKYPFDPVVVIDADVPEGVVGELFVRVNDGGTKLREADFLLTLLSAQWENGRRRLEAFCRKANSPGQPGYNEFIQPSPDQLLRTVVAVGLGRAKLESVYKMMLRGHGKDDGEERGRVAELNSKLDHGLDLVTKLDNWTNFFTAIKKAGFIGRRLISSDNNLLFSYAFYLIGLDRFNMKHEELQEYIAPWFFMSALTQRYSASFESTTERDLGELWSPGCSFRDWMRHEILHELNEDYWTTRLPADLSTSSTRSPGFLSYTAALVVLDAPVLLSTASSAKISSLLMPAVVGSKTVLDVHHLFPRNYLAKIGIEDLTQVNSVANLTYVEWTRNIDVSDLAPTNYYPAAIEGLRIKSGFSESYIDDVSRFHALPRNWWELPYDQFLMARRQLMARVVRDGFERVVQGIT
jgi:hypothetical protein